MKTANHQNATAEQASTPQTGPHGISMSAVPVQRFVPPKTDSDLLSIEDGNLTDEIKPETIQGKFIAPPTNRPATETKETKPFQLAGVPAQAKVNNTGMPDQLKSGIENLSGFSMDDVKVHYNSDKPAQLQAYAYAQGTDIHIRPGHEKYLPHEAWHVVQQKHGRVAPTKQFKGFSINNDSALEREADLMGQKALTSADNEAPLNSKADPQISSAPPVQMGGGPGEEDDDDDEFADFMDFNVPVVKGYEPEKRGEARDINSEIAHHIGLRQTGRTLTEELNDKPILRGFGDPELTSSTEDRAPTLIKEQLSALNTREKIDAFLKKFKPKQQNNVAEQIDALLRADVEGDLETIADHMMDAVSEDFESDQWRNLEKALSRYKGESSDDGEKTDQREDKAQKSTPPPSVGVPEKFTFEDFTKYLALKGTLQADAVLLKLITAKAIVATDPPGARGKPKLKEKIFSGLPGLEEIVKSVYAKSPETAKLINGFLLPRLVVPENIHEKMAKLEEEQLSTFSDWFHSFATTLNLLTNRDDITDEQLSKLLKFQLTKYQVQATYSLQDTRRLGRQASPLVNEGYGRGIKTGMWDIARKINEKQIEEQFAEAVKTAAMDSKAVSAEKGKAKNFNLFPANEPFNFRDVKPVVKDKVPANVYSLDSIYISSLKVQMIKVGAGLLPGVTAKDKQDEAGKVNTLMGGKGLRTSASESANVIVTQMIKFIRQKDMRGALNVIASNASFTPEQEEVQKQVITQMQTINLDVNTIVAPKGRDPLLQTADTHLDGLKSSYDSFKLYKDGVVPFFVKQNVSVIFNLIGDDIKAFISINTPAMVTAELADNFFKARQVISDCIVKIPKAQKGKDDDPLNTDKLVENFYRQMQNIHHIIRFQLNWKGDATTMDAALKAMLPEGNTVTPRMTQSAPHGLAMISHVQNSLAETDKGDKTAIMHGAYYETPHLFPDATSSPSVTDAGLKSKKVIVMEPHPNNAASDTIQPHNPVELINNLFTGGGTGPYTVIMDVTLNHLGEKQIADTLNAAKRYIDDGKLNLVMLQSGTKFFQNGMDLVNIGTALIFNDGASWVDFNKKLSDAKLSVPKEDELYIANMLAKNKQNLQQYLDKIRENTARLREILIVGLGRDNAFEVLPNTDLTTVYIAFQPKDDYVKKKLRLPSSAVIDADTRSTVNKPVYKNEVLPALSTLPSIDRSSFGFNTTNFGECYNTVRITPGIENIELLTQYNDKLIALGERLWQEVMLPPVPSTTDRASAPYGLTGAAIPDRKTDIKSLS